MNDEATRIPVTATAANDSGDEPMPDILSFIGDAQPTSTDERRSRDRFPIAYDLLLTPIDSDGNLLPDQTIRIAGKDLSVRGFCFSHMGPLRYCRAVVSFAPPNPVPLTVEAEIMWTRQTPIGLYESGCRFIQKIARNL
jgi:hypothetical protein